MAKGIHEAVPDVHNEDVEIYINGEFFARAEAKMSVFDSGYLVGDGPPGPRTARLGDIYGEAVEVSVAR